MQQLTKMLRREDRDTSEDETKRKGRSKFRSSKISYTNRNSLIVNNDGDSNIVFRNRGEQTNPPNCLTLVPISSHKLPDSNVSSTTPDTTWKASLLTSQDCPGMDLVGGSRVRVMYKEGDDLRQDVVVLQFLRLMDKLWKNAGLDLPMVIYRVQPTAFRKGVIEMVPNCMTWQDILDKFGSDDQAPIRYLKSHNPTTRMYVCLFAMLSNIVDAFEYCCSRVEHAHSVIYKHINM